MVTPQSDDEEAHRQALDTSRFSVYNAEIQNQDIITCPGSSAKKPIMKFITSKK